MIILRIESVDSLPDGGPIEFTARQRSFEIGREQHLDWTLPDPERFISGRHCEVRFEKGGYWLYDVSRNGTFLNGSLQRMKSPYRLAGGDRLTIGPYLVGVSFGEVAAAKPAPAAAARDSEEADFGGDEDIWDVGAAVAAPAVDRRDFLPEKRHLGGDFSVEFLDLPDVFSPGAAPAEPSAKPSVKPGAPGRESPFADSGTPGELSWSAAPGEGRPDDRPAQEVAPSWFGEGAMPPSRFSEAPPRLPTPAGAVPRPASSPRGDREASNATFLQALAAGAGVSPEVFAHLDQQRLATEIGEFIHVIVENLAQQLRARAAAKSMTKSANRTMISASDNNPLKFIPVPAEAIEIMFAGKRNGYLGAKRAAEDAFSDLRRHELATYTAMQKALAQLLEDLSPDAIESAAGGSAFSPKKMRAWDLFVARWEAKEAGENGMVDAFFAHFSQAYDKASRGK